MALPQGVLDFLNEQAETAGAPRPGDSDDLFASGVLDSFALVDFVALLEDECGIKIPDSDVNPGNFQTIETIERYVDSHRG
jgi:acyl carrier protein